MHDDLRIECTKCPGFINRRGVLVKPSLHLIEDNYSGCGIDIMECPECHTVFTVSYKVDKIEERQ